MLEVVRCFPPSIMVQEIKFPGIWPIWLTNHLIQYRTTQKPIYWFALEVKGARSRRMRRIYSSQELNRGIVPVALEPKTFLPQDSSLTLFRWFICVHFGSPVSQCWAWITSAPPVSCVLAPNPSESFLVLSGVSSAVPWLCTLALRSPENFAFPSSMTLDLF